MTFNSSVSGTTGRVSYIWTEASLTPQTLATNTVLFNLVLTVVPTAVGVVTISFENSPTPLLVADNNLNSVTGIVYTPGTVNIPWALPTTLNQFTLSKNNNTVTLNWSTSTEKNIAYYEVEKSLNGTDFFPIHQTKAVTDNFGSNQYDYNDVILNNLGLNAIFYRIKIVNNDGGFFYSKIVSIKDSNKSDNLVIYPNPAKGNINIQIKSDLPQAVLIQIVDLFGKIVSNSRIQLSVGCTSFSINTLNLATGNYFLIMKGNVLVTRKIVME